MPRKQKHPCAMPGCPNLTDGTYCEVHKKQEAKRYNTLDRNPVTRKMYKGQWTKIRNKYVEMHPFCEVCLANGILTKVEEVHHKLPLAEGGTHDPSNLISLCRSCHSKIHMERGDRGNHRRTAGQQMFNPGLGTGGADHTHSCLASVVKEHDQKYKAEVDHEWKF